MKERRREVWITGIETVTAYGLGLDALVQGLAIGRTAASPPLPGDDLELLVRYIAEVRDPIPSDPRYQDDRKVLLLLETARRLLASTDLGPGPHARLGTYLGTGLSSVTPSELATDLYPHLRGKCFDRLSLAADLACRGGSPNRHHPARATRALATLAGAEGPVQTNFSACAASAQAIADAARAIRRGDLDMALAGGHDSMTHPLGLASFVLLGTVASGPCRPFDRRRDGFVLGEGSAILLLEDADHARARGARPLARFLGAGTSVDAHAVTAPHPEGQGAWLAMVRALRDAGLPPSSVSQVNCHGTGTPVGDVAESLAISRLFPDSVCVCSIKGAVGHTIAAAGAVELAASIGAMAAGFMPGTVGCDEPDPACPIPIQKSPLHRTPSVIVSNSFGFGGQNASLVVGHPDFEA